MSRRNIWSEMVNSFHIFQEEEHYFIQQEGQHPRLLVREELEELAENLNKELGRTPSIGDMTPRELGQEVNKVSGSNYVWLLIVESILENRLTLREARAIRRMVKDLL